DDGSGNQPGTQHTVKFADPGGKTFGVGGVNFGDRTSQLVHADSGWRGPGGSRGGTYFFDGAPGLAFATASGPFRGHPTAFIAFIGKLRVALGFGHDAKPSRPLGHDKAYRFGR